MMPMQSQLERPEIRKVLKRHRSSLRELARDLKVSSSMITSTLKGRSKSKRVIDAARQKALALLEEEKLAGAA